MLRLKSHIILGAAVYGSFYFVTYCSGIQQQQQQLLLLLLLQRAAGKGSRWVRGHCSSRYI